MSTFVSVAKVSDFDNQQAKCVEVEGKSIALIKLGDKFFAIDDTCWFEKFGEESIYFLDVTVFKSTHFFRTGTIRHNSVF